LSDRFYIERQGHRIEIVPETAFIILEEWEKGTVAHKIADLLGGRWTGMMVIAAAAKLGIERPWRNAEKLKG
jgi:hypothetical protein